MLIVFVGATLTIAIPEIIIEDGLINHLIVAG
jgi:hypothetical protein